MKCWNTAGTTANFTPTALRIITDTLRDVSTIQNQLNMLAHAGGGRLLVPEGRFEIHQTIRIPSNVSLIGLSREGSILEIKMMEDFEKSRHWMKPQGNAAAILLEGVNNASVENLTLIYNPVDFEPLDFDTYDHEWVRAVFHEDDSRTSRLFVTSIWLERAENCLISNCNILQAGNDPIRLRYSKHITLSHNLVDRAFNKGNGGAGYYNLIHSHYCLIYKETIRRIRHFSIHKGSSYNVVYGCDFQTDINFHNGDRGNNLIENNDINIPHWHSWQPFGTGDPSKHEPPGPNNVLYRNRVDYKGRGYDMDETVLYMMPDYYPDRSMGQTKFIVTDLADSFSHGIYQIKHPKE
jgi:parallel beta-helix repeat protein